MFIHLDSRTRAVEVETRKGACSSSRAGLSRWPRSLHLRAYDTPLLACCSGVCCASVVAFSTALSLHPSASRRPYCRTAASPAALRSPGRTILKCFRLPTICCAAPPPQSLASKAFAAEEARARGLKAETACIYCASEFKKVNAATMNNSSVHANSFTEINCHEEEPPDEHSDEDFTHEAEEEDASACDEEDEQTEPRAYAISMKRTIPLMRQRIAAGTTDKRVKALFDCGKRAFGSSSHGDASREGRARAQKGASAALLIVPLEVQALTLLPSALTTRRRCRR